MNTILFKVNGNRIRRTNGFEPTSGEKNYSQLKFVFDEEWEGVPAVSVLQFFDESDIPEPIVKEITDNAVVVPVNEKLRGKEGILHIGVAGAKADGTTVDTRIIHVPVGEGFKLCGNESTLMYLNLLAYVARLLDATITEDNPLTSERLAKGSVREEHIPDYSITPKKLSKNYVEYATALIRTYGDLDAIISLQKDDTLFRVEVSGLCAFRSTLGEGYFTAVSDSNLRELTIKNHSTGGEWLYRKLSEELIPLVASSQSLDNHIAEVNEKGGMVTLTDPQLDALDNLFDLTAYTSDKGKDAYEAFVKAFGLDNYRVQREFTIDELFPCGLSYLREANLTNAVMSEYGYYTKQGTNRYGYIYFDIPCKYGYTYKFDFETTQSTDNIAIELYNEYALNQVEAEGDYRSADHKEYNWIGNGGEITPPELINGYAPAGLRFVFNTGTPAVTKIKISKKRVL